MGLNICGFITNQTLSDQPGLLQTAIGELSLQETVTFEEALAAKYESEVIDLHEQEGLTLALCNQDLLEEDSDLSVLSANGHQLVEFMLSDTAMVYAFRFYEKGQLKGEDYYVFEPEFTCHGNDLLQLSEDSDFIEDGLNAVMKQMNHKPFSTIEVDEEVKRFAIT